MKVDDLGRSRKDGLSGKRMNKMFCLKRIRISKIRIRKE